MTDNVIIALDFKNKMETLAFLDFFSDEENAKYPHKPYVKIGMELFYFEGPLIISLIKERGHKIFLDLKLHDIPNTVYKAMINLSKLGVSMTNVHAKGGIEMMMMAKKGLSEGNPSNPPLLIAVTELTSTSQEILNHEFQINQKLEDVVSMWGENASKANLDGLVCSPLETKMLKEKYPNLLLVTPGIRLKGESLNDQVRVSTPNEALLNGSDYIVVGRTITNSSDPKATYKKIYDEFNKGK